HREVRPSARDAGFVDLRDAGMLETPERMRFLLEAAQNLGNRQARLHHFECYLAARSLLLCLVYNTHSAFTDQTQDSIGADRPRRAWSGTPTCHTFQKPRSCNILIEERLDFAAQFFVPTAGFSEKCSPSSWVALDRLLIHHHNLFPALGV